MAHILKDIYPGLVTIDENNPDGTFKNRTNGILKDGTPFERRWASDLWGFATHLLNKALIIPDGSEENINNSQIFDAIQYLIALYNDLYLKEYIPPDFTVSGTGWTTLLTTIRPYLNPTPGAALDDMWRAKIFIWGLKTNSAVISYTLTISNITFSIDYGNQPGLSFVNLTDNPPGGTVTAVPNTGQLIFYNPSSVLTDFYAMFGDFRLLNKPSFVP